MSYKFDENPEFHVWDLEDYTTIDSKKRFDSSWITKYIKPGTAVMDIGCGPGYFVKVLHDNGVKVLGVDLNKNSIQRAKQEGLPVVEMDALEAIKSMGSEYSIFVMNDFVEHVPLEVVIDILKLLKSIPNAIIFLATPNLDSLMGFKFWFHMPTHINAMHPYVIRNMLTKMNYDIIKEWSEYGQLPGSGFKLWLRKKILYALFGTQAQLFLGGANICYIFKNKP